MNSLINISTYLNDKSVLSYRLDMYLTNNNSVYLNMGYVPGGNASVPGGNAIVPIHLNTIENSQIHNLMKSMNMNIDSLVIWELMTIIESKSHNFKIIHSDDE